MLVGCAAALDTIGIRLPPLAMVSAQLPEPDAAKVAPAALGRRRGAHPRSGRQTLLLLGARRIRLRRQEPHQRRLPRASIERVIRVRQNGPVE